MLKIADRRFDFSMLYPNSWYAHAERIISSVIRSYKYACSEDPDFEKHLKYLNSEDFKKHVKTIVMLHSVLPNKVVLYNKADMPENPIIKAMLFSLATHIE